VATVRVMAVKLQVTAGPWPVPKLAYHAQIYSDDGRELLWTCGHQHGLPVDAQDCGVQQLTDQVVGQPRMPRSASA